jgi:hypothetical protein
VAPAEPPPELLPELPEDPELLPAEPWLPLEEPELPLEELELLLDEGGEDAPPLWVGVLALGQPLRAATEVATSSSRAASACQVLTLCNLVGILSHHILCCHWLSCLKPWPERFCPDAAQ